MGKSVDLETFKNKNKNKKKQKTKPTLQSYKIFFIKEKSKLLCTTPFFVKFF